MLDIIYKKILKEYNEISSMEGYSNKDRKRIINRYSQNLFEKFVPAKKFYVIFVRNNKFGYYQQAYFDKDLNIFVSQNLTQYTKQEFKKVYVKSGFLTIKEIQKNLLANTFNKNSLEKLINKATLLGFSKMQIEKLKLVYNKFAKKNHLKIKKDDLFLL